VPARAGTRAHTTPRTCTRLRAPGQPGKPLFGTLIALLRNGRPVLGIIDQPITRERWVGVAVHDSSSGGGGGSDGCSC
jgi:hypothetical protein